MALRKNFQEEPRWVLIPVIDVLLAVFLFLAVLAFQKTLVAVPVELPRGEGIAAPLKYLSVVITPDGKIEVGKKVLTLEKLGELVESKKPDAVNLYADRKTPYGVVMEVFNLLRKKGVDRVNLFLEKT